MHINTREIKPKENYTELDFLMGRLEHVYASVYSINDHNLECMQSTIRRQIHDQVKKGDKFAIAAPELSQEVYPHSYKPGGTILRIMGILSEKHLNHGVGSMDRWSWLTLRGEKEMKVFIISVYIVCQ